MNSSRLKYSIDIQATKATIWKALWNEDTYRTWAGVFFAGSYLLANDWNEGSKVFFLSPDESGIYSIIETHLPNKLIQFKHIGKVADGKEQAIDEDTKKWSGATERYSISEGEEANTLSIELDVMDEHLDFMKNKLPEALEVIRTIAENQK